MFEDLSTKLESAFKSVSGQARLSDINVAETVREIRRALLDADVNYEVARSLTSAVKEKALGQGGLASVTPGQQFTKIVYDELVSALGQEQEEITFSQVPPTVILIAGLQGSGKTTFSAKLAKWLKDQGKNPMLAAADVYRPAAVDQLRTLASDIDVPVHSIAEKDALRVAKEAVSEAKKAARDVLIIDTAGRMHVDEHMMDEVSRIRQTVNATEVLFVVDAMTGQDAVNTARQFNKQIDFDGVVLTKLDGDTRGGAAISIRNVVDKPIKFVSTGEKMDTISPFYPDRMAQRILGMGDVVTLVEKAQEQYDEVQARKLQSKLASNSFNLEDFYGQLQQIKKMGSMKDLVGMIPGMSKQLGDAEIDDDTMKPVEAIINSMTIEERRNPQIIKGSRRKRIAQGSGTTVREVNDLLKQFGQMKKMMKTMTKMNKAGRAMEGLKNLTGKRKFH
ncbi:signal recognition particle protein [Natronogracilivirga saccharolytica]|uniref:Signal recognition particle protein n=1 Tax=Natronogracilivirga saccharolytica TaxID=2812953 RepID=A0A8J7RKX2_9BACT|nr:signal recognition particle protein [Natronogracilivirga saccharolytica]MBP3191554.1 signal recognition particle protein [Natronogracilivirga saccharolytica]